MDAFDEPGLSLGAMAISPLRVLKVRGGDVSFGEDGVDDKDGNVNGGVDVGGRGRCARSLGKERHKWHGKSGRRRCRCTTDTLARGKRRLGRSGRER